MPPLVQSMRADLFIFNILFKFRKVGLEEVKIGSDIFKLRPFFLGCGSIVEVLDLRLFHCENEGGVG